MYLHILHKDGNEEKVPVCTVSFTDAGFSYPASVNVNTMDVSNVFTPFNDVTLAWVTEK